MKHNLKVSIRKKPSGEGLVFCRKYSIREKLLNWLLGEKRMLTVIVPGDTVECISIQELSGGTHE